MTNPTFRYSTLSIDGVEYKLAYSFNSIAECEAESRCNLLEGLDSLDSMNALQLRGLFYAALKPLQPLMTVEQAGDMIAVNGIVGVAAAVAVAYKLSLQRTADPPLAGPPPA